MVRSRPSSRLQLGFLLEFGRCTRRRGGSEAQTPGSLRCHPNSALSRPMLATRSGASHDGVGSAPNRIRSVRPSLAPILQVISVILTGTHDPMFTGPEMLLSRMAANASAVSSMYRVSTCCPCEHGASSALRRLRATEGMSLEGCSQGPYGRTVYPMRSSSRSRRRRLRAFCPGRPRTRHTWLRA